MCSPCRTMLAEAIATVNGAIVLGFKRDFGFLAALRADYRMHLPLLFAVAMTFALVTAVAATHRLIFKALFRIKFLFARAENKFFSAVLAHECFVFKSHR